MLSNLIYTILVVLFASTTVVVASVEDQTCDYFCNYLSNDDFQISSIVKNYRDLTLGQYAQKMGTIYKYYFLCCDGKLVSRDSTNMIRSSDMKAISQAVTISNPITSMVSLEISRNKYCVVDTKAEKVIIKFSNNTKMSTYINKNNRNYFYFSYCDDGAKSVKGNMVIFNIRFEQFKINVNQLKLTIDKNSDTTAEKDLNAFKESYAKTKCVYFCNYNGDYPNGNGLVLNSKGENIKQHALSLASQYKFTSCCDDGKMMDRMNLVILDRDGTVLPSKAFNTDNQYNYVDLEKTCDYYCGYDSTKKVIYYLNSKGLSLKNFITTNDKTYHYDYYSYCCKLEKSFTEVMVGANKSLEEFDIVIKGYNGNKSKLENN